MKSPAFQFYPKDFLSDGRTMMMPNDVLGIYVRLLCFDWVDDGLPDDTDLWRRLVAFEEPTDDIGYGRTWEEVVSWVEHMFVRHPNKAHHVTNPRLQTEREGQAERREKRAEAGRESGRIRKSRTIPQGSSTNNAPILFEQNANKEGTKTNSSSSSASTSANIYTPNGVYTPIVPKTRISKPKEPIEIIYPPTWSESHIETFKRWMEYRTQIRKPLKAMSYQAQLQKFSDNPDQLAKLIIRAIEKAWQGLNEEIPFEYKANFVDNEKSRVEKNLEFAKNYLKELEDEEKNSH